MSEKTRLVKVGNKAIGGGSPVTVQSMTCTDTRDIPATVAQIKRLEEADCDIVRLAVVDTDAAVAVRSIKRQVSIPVVADIHFDYKLALECVKSGADKIRINPGNIGSRDRIKAVADACREMGIPIRIGVNSGSLEKKILDKYKCPCAEALAESALYNAQLLEDCGFSDIVLSVKSSDVREMIQANRILSRECDYPLHLGVTEAGGADMGTIKNTMGIGALLCDEIGDTIRVSLTADPVMEVEKGIAILKSLGLRGGVDIISCPTCGRCRVDLFRIASEVEKALGDARYRSSKKRYKVAVMGCAVNGPGEARHADIGVAGGDGEVLLFAKGKIIGKCGTDEACAVLLKELDRIMAEDGE
ncbi:MAG: flavodoxin-dependent (E)-4-hydroxy-3-methylbut-2-enyl-diphosphate synthase [Eubacteriales bacterium]